MRAATVLLRGEKNLRAGKTISPEQRRYISATMSELKTARISVLMIHLLPLHLLLQEIHGPDDLDPAVLAQAQQVFIVGHDDM